MTAWRQPAPTGPQADAIVRRLQAEGRLGPGVIEGQAEGGGLVEGALSGGEQSELGEQSSAEANDPAQGPGLSSPDSLSSPSQEETWPELDPAALHGLAGRLVATLGPHTEADPAALLLTFLVAFGNAVGPGPRALVGATEHPARLNVLLVGQTARARKGTAQAEVNKVMALADPGWFAERMVGGLASGEGLIAAVRDPTGEDTAAPADKRLLCVEAEFVRVLGVAAREGNTLSAVLRQAWDDGRLRTMTRKDPLRASGAHISIIGHITAEELRRRLGDTEIANGFVNRFLLAAVRRSKRLPEGGTLTPAALGKLAGDVAKALGKAREVGSSLVRRLPASAGPRPMPTSATAPTGWPGP